MDALWGFLLLIPLLVGVWFLARWAWRALTWPARRLRTRVEPTGLGSDYERLVRDNQRAATATTARSLSSPAPRPASDFPRPAATASAAPRTTVAATRQPADRLRQLDELRNAGLVTPDEYATKRAEVLAQI